MNLFDFSPTARKQRRSERISLSLPIRVSGQDTNGQQFLEDNRTILVSRHGASVALEAELATGQEVNIRCGSTGKEALARVVGQTGGKPGSHIYSLGILSPNVNFWGIEFPPPEESTKAVARLVLECSLCQARELAYLDELETEVFQANQAIAWYCKGCTRWTLCKQALPESSHEEVSPRPRLLRRQNERQEVRIPLHLTACVRLPRTGEEVVVTENISRGGFCFKSKEQYRVGSRIEISAPYTPGALNVFSSARIVGVQDLPDEGRTQYRVAYTR